MTDEEQELAGMAQSDRPATQRDLRRLAKVIRARQDIIEKQDAESHGWTAFLVFACTTVTIAVILFADALRAVLRSIIAGAS
jgi:hypothetical protein